MTGYITKGIGGFYYVKTSEGIVECKPRGIFRKQKTAYEIPQCDWSSDVCSSDLPKFPASSA